MLAYLHRYIPSNIDADTAFYGLIFAGVMVLILILNILYKGLTKPRAKRKWNSLHVFLNAEFRICFLRQHEIIS